LNTVERFQRPGGEKFAKPGFVDEMPQFLALARQESEAGAIIDAVDDAGIGVGSIDLLPGARDGVRA